MRPEWVVEVEVAREPRLRISHRLIGPEIHLLVFEAAPESLHDHVVPPAARPSMLSWMPGLFRNPVNSRLVN
jgi:hypothetical protein